MAVIPRTRAGLVKFRPVGPGSRVALVAPASPFNRGTFEKGVAELARLGFEPVYDERIFAEHPIVAGPPALRAELLTQALTRQDVDAVIAVRGGYGSMEVLPYLDAAHLRRRRTAFVGYSDTTALHAFLNGHVRMTSVHGAMVEGRLSGGPSAYDSVSFVSSLGVETLGELTRPGVEIIRPGEAVGPLVGGTLTQLAASLGTPYEFLPPRRYVLFLEEIGERPYRIRRLLTQISQSGRLSDAVALVFGEMVRCDEPGGGVTARSVIAEFTEHFPGPVMFGFPSGHTEAPCVSLPFGVEVRVVAHETPRLVFMEAAAA